MSGLCGAVAFREASPVLLDIGATLEQLRRRGPDRTGVWQGERAALGHALLATTPEALEEALPLHHAPSGCVITADARIDNRGELLAALGVDTAGRVVGDGELVLFSYLRWGERCPERLLGDFAFAIWDERRSRLFCARDQMGMRRLAFSELSGRGLVFATEPDAVVRHPLVEARVNEYRIADYLEGFEDWNPDSTFFEGVSRLLPGHILTADANGVSVQRYWQLQPEPELKLGSDQQYVEAFTDVFEEAVRCRLRSSGAVGSMLSGGVDSASAATVAASLSRQAGNAPLKTFSAIGPSTKDSVETRSIHVSMNGIPDILPSTISYADLGEHLADLVRGSMESAEPFDADMTIIRAVYMLASEAGVKVVLDGASADVVLASSTLVNGLLRQGKFRRAIREARGEHAFYGSEWPAWRALSTGAWHAFSPRPLRDAKRRLSGSLKDRSLLRNGLVHPDFAHRIGYLERRRRYRTQSAGSRLLDPLERVAWIADGTLTAGRERYERVAAGLGVEARDPFIDLRMVRFCLSLPWSQLQRNGYPKFILRKAMEGRVPDYVLWRSGIEHHGRDFTWAMFSGAPDICSSVERSRETICQYVDLAKAALGRYGPKDSDRFADWLTTVYLANWLETIAGRAGCLDHSSQKGMDDARRIERTSQLLGTPVDDLWRHGELYCQRKWSQHRDEGQQGYGPETLKPYLKASMGAFEPSQSRPSRTTHINAIFSDAQSFLPFGWNLHLTPEIVPPANAEPALWSDENDLLEVSFADGRFFFSFLGFATFEVEPASRTCRIWADSAAEPETLRHLIFDQILPRLVAQQGRLVLHAAALLVPVGAVLLVGPSGRGKSTLAASFHDEYVKLIGDDAIILSNGSGSIMCEATYPSLRLNPDSLTALFAVLPPTASVAQYTAKRAVQGFSGQDVGRSPVAAIFVIAEPGGDQVSARRMRISDACMALVEQSFSLNPADTQCAQQRLLRASEAASAIPAFSLSFPRDYSRLPAVRECIMDLVRALDGAAAGR